MIIGMAKHTKKAEKKRGYNISYSYKNRHYGRGYTSSLNNRIIRCDAYSYPRSFGDYQEVVCYDCKGNKRGWVSCAYVSFE